MKVLFISLAVLAAGVYADSLRGDDLTQGSKAKSVTVSESGNTLTLSNRFVALMFDFSNRRYSVSDAVSKEVVLDNAWLSADGFASANIPLRNVSASVAEKEIITHALADVEWAEADKKLVGAAKVVGGDSFRIVLAGNGRRAVRASATGAQAKLEAHPAGSDYITLVLDRRKNGETPWHVDYE
jgi:hypothetical protein